VRRREFDFVVQLQSNSSPEAFEWGFAVLCVNEYPPDNVATLFVLRNIAVRYRPASLEYKNADMLVTAAEMIST
jgi:hypothetical protein